MAAGHFFIAAITPAFVSKETDRNQFQSGKEIHIEAGENIENIDFSITRGAVITGRITDSGGKPVIAQRISLYKFNENDPKQPNFVQTDAETDDRGVYRIYGLDAGRYAIGIGRAKNSYAVAYGARPTYELTYYPNTNDITQAKTINLSAGDEATDIDIQLPPPNKTYEATGRVVDAETNQPVSNATIFLSTQPSTDGRRTAGFTSNGSQTDENGEFRIKNVLPGRYSAFANIGERQFSSENQSDFYSDPANFEINRDDVNGIEIRLKRGAAINGTVIFDGAQTAAKLSDILVTAFPADGSNSPLTFKQTQVNADGSFHIGGLRPGKIRINIFSGSQMKRIMPLRVERDGNVQPDSIDIVQNEQINNVRVIIASGTGILRGRVIAANGIFPPNRRIGISLRRVGEQRGLGSTTADALGRFVFENLPAGDYVMFISASSGISQLGNTKLTINISDTGETKINVTLDLSNTTNGAKQ